MKQKISKLLKVGVLALMFLGISCSVEEPQDSNLENNAKYSKKWITLPELSSVAGATENLARISANSAKISGREIYDNANDFTIHTDEMLLIEGEGLQTITFSVSRNYEEKNLENLIMVRDSNGKFSAYLASYAFDDADIEIVSNEGIPTDTPQKTMISSLESFVSPFGKEGNNDVPMCEYVDHITLQNGVVTVTFIIKPCNNEGGSGGGSGSGGGNNSGGVGSGTPNGPSGPSGGGNDNPPSPSTPNTGSNPGQHGGGGGNSGGGTVVTSPVTMTPAQALTARKKAFSQRLRSESLQLAFNALPANVQNELWNFLESSLTNGELTLIASAYPVQAIEFAVQATSALTEGGEVDFAYRIIKDSTFEDNPCLNSVYNQLGNAPTFQNYLKNFDGDFSVANLKLKGSSILPESTNAETSAPENYLITITFNINNLDRPTLEIARTFIHELIHAEIFRKLLSCAGLPNVNFNNYTQDQFQQYMIALKNNFPGLFDYYLRYAYNTQNPTGFQHQQMAQHYRNIIAQALKQFDNNAQPDNVYQALAWEGLMGTGPINPSTQLPEFPTVAWQNTPLSQRIEIRNLITTYSNTHPPCQ